jgi:catechol 2,3-dioxygenase-like lactoylglutathione lyase family enzyme
MAVFRYLVGDVDAAIAFYMGNLGFTLEQQMGPAFAIVLSFRNEIVTGPGGKQIVLDDRDGNPIELFEARRYQPVSRAGGLEGSLSPRPLEPAFAFSFSAERPAPRLSCRTYCSAVPRA